MSHWYFAHLAVTGNRKDVNAFNRIALRLPVLSDYVTSRNGRPVTQVLYEDMVFETPLRWGQHWWRSWYLFQTRDIVPATEMVRGVSREYSGLCFQLDWDFEHEEFGSHFFRRGRDDSCKFDGQALRERIVQQLSRGKEDDNEEVDDRFCEEVDRRLGSLWRKKTYDILRSQNHRTAS
jgi:hypothetical protein